MSDKEPKLTQSEQALLSEKSKKFDENASSESCIEDLRELQKQNPLKFITRNFYRINGTYSDATWNRHFGTFLEFRRQAGLELSRNQHAIERQVAKHASVDVYRKFYKDEVLPYHQKYNWTKKQKGRFKTMLIGSDFHDIECDPFVLDVFCDVNKRLKPDVIGLNGDVYDLYEFSRFNIDVRKIQIGKRFDYVKEKIYRRLRNDNPDAQISLITGNHEWRLLKHLADKSIAMKVFLSDVMGLSLAQCFGLDEFKINLIAKLDFEAWSATDVQNELKQNYEVFWNSFVLSHFKDLSFGMSGSSGHTHRPELVTFANIPMGKLSWTTTGCIAKTEVEYVDSMDSMMNGFLYVIVDTYEHTATPVPILIPGDFVVVEGKLYERKKT
jgi:hypothetical protein